MLAHPWHWWYGRLPGDDGGGGDGGSGGDGGGDGEGGSPIINVKLLKAGVTNISHWVDPVVNSNLQLIEGVGVQWSLMALNRSIIVLQYNSTL